MDRLQQILKEKPYADSKPNLGYVVERTRRGLMSILKRDSPVVEEPQRSGVYAKDEILGIIDQGNNADNPLVAAWYIRKAYQKNDTFDTGLDDELGDLVDGFLEKSRSQLETYLAFRQIDNASDIFANLVYLERDISQYFGEAREHDYSANVDRMAKQIIDGYIKLAENTVDCDAAVEMFGTAEKFFDNSVIDFTENHQEIAKPFVLAIIQLGHDLAISGEPDKGYVIYAKAEELAGKYWVDVPKELADLEKELSQSEPMSFGSF